jgi:DNA-binding response OmpR family regulator
VDTVRLRADAREALANTACDAAILDLGLPDGDGLNLLTELRPAGNRIPILILTARAAGRLFDKTVLFGRVIKDDECEDQNWGR